MVCQRYKFQGSIQNQYKQTFQIVCVAPFEHEVSVIYYNKYLIDRIQKNVAAKTQ